MSKSKTKNETKKVTKSKAGTSKRPRAKKSPLSQDNLLFNDNNTKKTDVADYKVVSVFTKECLDFETNDESIASSSGLQTYTYPENQVFSDIYGNTFKYIDGVRVCVHKIDEPIHPCQKTHFRSQWKKYAESFEYIDIIASVLVAISILASLLYFLPK